MSTILRGISQYGRVKRQDEVREAMEATVRSEARADYAMPGHSPLPNLIPRLRDRDRDTSLCFQVDTGRHLLALVTYRKHTVGVTPVCHTFDDPAKIGVLRRARSAGRRISLQRERST